jgi:hypothetical protein
MAKRKASIIKRIPLRAVGIEEPVKIRMKRYISTLRPKPSESSVVTQAVIEYLDRQERQA